MEFIKPKITNLQQIEMLSEDGLPLTALLYSRAFVENCDVPLKSKQAQSKIVCFNSHVFTKITPMYVTIPVGSPVYDKDYLQKTDLINFLMLKNKVFKNNWTSIIVNTVAECKNEYPDLDYHIIEELGPTTFNFFSGSVEDFFHCIFGVHLFILNEQRHFCEHTYGNEATEFANTFNKYFSKLTKYHKKIYVIDLIAQKQYIDVIKDSVIKTHQYLDEEFYDLNKVCDSDKEPINLQSKNLIDEFLQHIEHDIKANTLSIFNHMPFHAERLIFLTNDKDKLNEKI